MKIGMKTAIAILAVCVMPCTGMAAQPWTGPYISGFAGLAVLDDSDATTDFTSGGVIEDRLKYDPGYYVGGTGGYDFGLMRLEGEISYKNSNIDSIRNQTEGFRYGSPNGDIGALAVMFNIFFDLHNDSPVTPYLGGGVGFATLYLSDTFGTDPVEGRLTLYLEDDDTVFAYQGGTGVEISLNQNLSLDLGYRYFRTSDGTFNADFGSVTETEFESHNAMAGLRIKF